MVLSATFNLSLDGSLMVDSNTRHAPEYVRSIGTAEPTAEPFSDVGNQARTMSQESDEYELFVEKVYRKLLGAKVSVHHRKPYTGRVSGREIIVDLSFNYDLAGADLLCVIECKCYNHAVPVDDVEEFHSKLDDIGAQKGIMITTIGYQDGAIKTAKGRRIALALLTTKPLTGELTFVVNVGGRDKPPGQKEEFLQGNLRAPLDHFEGGYRFDGIHQFLNTLFKEEHEEWYRKKYLPLLE